MNLMTLRRDALVDQILDFLKVTTPDYEWFYADRLREETMNGASRQNRIHVMGDPTRYFEVLFGGYETLQVDSVGRRVLDGSTFKVNLWHFYADHDDYEKSTQKIFDTICFSDDGGIITGLNDLDDLSTWEGKLGMGWIQDISAIETMVVSLDSSAKELAHFLTFNITIR